MLRDRSAQGIWRLAGLCVLLCYPIMAIKWLPFGGGARYLSVLAAPVGLLMLLQTPRNEWRGLLLSAWRFSLPFLPFALGWTFAQIWHAYQPADMNPPTRVLWCALLFVGARQLGISYRHLAIVAGIAAVTYCVVAMTEVYGLGRDRAWGGTYENRFGQYAIWMAALCCLHVFFGKTEEHSRLLNAFLLTAAVLGVVATLLSGSRGALGALVVMILLFVLNARDWRRGLMAAVAMTTALLAFCLLYEPMYARVALIFQETRSYFKDPEFMPTSIGIRLELFRIAFLTLLDHPVIGPGYTSLKQLYETHPAFGAPSPEMLGIPGFHNDWAQAVGVGGGMLLLALVTTCIWMGVSARRDVFRLAFLGFAVVFSFSEIFFTNKMGLSLLMACWALYSAAEQNQYGKV